MSPSREITASNAPSARVPRASPSASSVSTLVSPARAGPLDAKERMVGEMSVATTRPAGRVVATDISPTILSFAARGAARAGLTNVETLEADGEALGTLAEGAFDAVISRLGLIYFPDRHLALTGMSRVLREGGRLAAMAFSTADRNEFFSIPVSIIRDRAQLAPPEPGQPGPFSLSAPGVLEAALEAAGFREVSVQTLPAPLRLPSAAECVRFERESFGALHQMLAAVPKQERDQVWADV